MKRMILASFFLFITPLLHALALDVPPGPRGRISDYTGTLDTGEVHALEKILADFEHRTTNQVAVVIIPTLAGDDLEDYSIRLAEKWKIGHKGRDNGIILLIVKNDRKVRIEVGYGLEGALPDSLAGDIIRNTLAPFFRRNDFSGGIRQALDRIISATAGEFVSQKGNRPVRPGIDVPLIKFLIFFSGLIGIVLICGGREWLQRRRKRLLMEKSDGSASGIPEILTEPPDSRSPGVVSQLLGKDNTTRAVIATLIDLANRGAVSVKQKIRTPWPLEPADIKKRIEEFRKSAGQKGSRKQCISCGKSDVYRGYIEEGYQGDWCPHCKKSQNRMKTELEHFVRVLDPGKLSSEVERKIIGIISEKKSMEGLVCRFFIHLKELKALFRKEAFGGEEEHTESDYAAAAAWRAFERYLARLDEDADIEARESAWLGYLPYAVVFELEWTLLRVLTRCGLPNPAWFKTALVRSRETGGKTGLYDPGRHFPNAYLGAMIDALEDILNSVPDGRASCFYNVGFQDFGGSGTFGGGFGGFGGFGGGFGGGGASGGW